MNDRLEHIRQMLRPHGLRHEVVESMLVSFRPGNIVSQPRDGDDDGPRGVCLLFELPDLAGGFEAVHDWHVEVEEDDAVAGADEEDEDDSSLEVGLCDL
jgi:hypothetical protein